MKRRKKSGSRFVFGLILCIVLGAFAGFYLGGCSRKQRLSQQKTSPNLHSMKTQTAEQPSKRSENAPEPEVHINQAPKSVASESERSTSEHAESKPEKVPVEYAKEPVGGSGEISQVKAKKREIALTFDAGASAEPADSILRTLARYGLHATFFLTGKWCEQNPDLVKRILAEGHEIGNHTYDHKDLRKLSDEEIAQEFLKMAGLVKNISGSEVSGLGRPPYGGRDARVLKLIRENGYVPIYWSVDSWDAFKVGITSTEIQNRVLNRVRGGDIVLMHCGSKPTADALPNIIEGLKGRGYKVVTVSTLINEQ